MTIALLVFFLALATTACTELTGTPAQAANDIVGRATATVERFRLTKEDFDFATYLKEAKGVVVLPRALKAGFIFGGEFGNGVLLVRQGDGTWGQPAFYTLTGGSFGFQIGIQDVETMLLLRSQKAVDAVIKHQAKFGADAGLSVGIFGAGVESGTTANLDADVLAFSRVHLGAYGGMSLEGAALVRRKDLNEAFYGAGAEPAAIVAGAQAANPAAEPLRAQLAAF